MKTIFEIKDNHLLPLWKLKLLSLLFWKYWKLKSSDGLILWKRPKKGANVSNIPAG